jgi:hypothetical protein
MEATATKWHIGLKQVHKTQWGFVPCDYEQFKKIKRLHFLYCENLRMAGRRKRYFRKESQNRVTRKIIRNKAGQKIGYGPKTPWRYPVMCDVFKFGSVVPILYERARRPVQYPDQVPKLPLSEKQVGKMLKKAEHWHKWTPEH